MASTGRMPEKVNARSTERKISFARVLLIKARLDEPRHCRSAEQQPPNFSKRRDLLFYVMTFSSMSTL
jgi:hypothetical protein